MRHRWHALLSCRIALALAVGCISHVGCCGQQKHRSGLSPAAADDLERQIGAALSHLNDAGVAGRLDYSDAVFKLADIGLPALPRVVPLLLSDDELLRSRAQSVLAITTSRMFGFVEGRGWPNADAERRHRLLWESLGNLGPDDDLPTREAAAQKWRAWLASGARLDPA
jgi:hypothetical protein